ncbi:hypothetical protein LRAMOSA09377 [Lichtheimia ramosa]|uniref:PHD-type domain-containing protein n=1 Tax=Lichtheimia ramosa TaxID=688394 RepID=A0A077WJT4_9FUNG|nr:hypothetical protein LRAMOSA09377 [Lichtheimia ramosa]
MLSIYRKSSALESLDNADIRSANVDTCLKKSSTLALRNAESSPNDENACPSPKRLKQQHDELSIIPQTFTTSHERQRVESTRHHRPNTGGKTVAAMRNLNKAGQNKRSSSKDDAQSLSTEQLKLLSRRIDPSAPLTSPHSSPTKPALPRSLSSISSSSQRTNSNHVTNKATPASSKKPGFSSSLYQTCSMIWSDKPPLLEDLQHDNIQYLSRLLKVRLSQAKARALASLEKKDTVDDLPVVRPRCETIRLSNKRHQCASSIVSGNSHHLFQRQARIRPYRQLPRTSTKTTSSKHTAPTASPQSTARKNVKTPVKRQGASTKGIVPVIQEDGSRVFVCEPCGKRYKNRNGLAYHLDRCRFLQEEQISNQQEDELLDEDDDEDNTTGEVRCICDTPQEQTGTMIECENCHTWQHMKCVEKQHDITIEDYQCPFCIDNISEPASTERPLRADHADEEDELAEDDEDTPQSSTPNDTKCEPTEQLTQDMMDDDLFLSVNNEETSEMEEESQQHAISEPWSQMMSGSSQDDMSFMHDPAFQTWGLSDFNLNPPSLLFSDNTANDDDINFPPSDIIPTEASQSDALWFEFANFDDDYQC